jgi:hypothetical protein
MRSEGTGILIHQPPFHSKGLGVLIHQLPLLAIVQKPIWPSVPSFILSKNPHMYQGLCDLSGTKSTIYQAWSQWKHLRKRKYTHHTCVWANTHKQASKSTAWLAKLKRISVQTSLGIKLSTHNYFVIYNLQMFSSTYQEFLVAGKTDGTGNHCVKQNKPDWGRQIFHVLSHL